MYEELIKRLRVSCESCKLWDGYKCCLKGECSAQKSLQAADAIEDLITALTASNEVIAKNKPKWIPVTERLPQKADTYLVFVANVFQKSMTATTTALWGGQNFIVGDFVTVTHWMPLPPLPESEEE